MEEREKARLEIAEKEAAERAEARRLAMERAAEARENAAAAESSGIIPPYPTIKRLDSGPRRYVRSSSYANYYGGFGYGYPVRYAYRPYFRYGGNRLEFGAASEVTGRGN